MSGSDGSGHDDDSFTSGGDGTGHDDGSHPLQAVMVLGMMMSRSVSPGEELSAPMNSFARSNYGVCLNAAEVWFAPCFSSAYMSAGRARCA